MRLHTAEGDEEHDEDEVGGDELDPSHEVMKNHPGQHGYRQHPRLKPLTQN